MKCKLCDGKKFVGEVGSEDFDYCPRCRGKGEIKREFKIIGAYLFKKRNDIGLSQEELAEVLNYKNGQFISNVERGLAGIPAKKLSELAEILQVPKNELVDELTKDYQHYFSRCANNC